MDDTVLKIALAAFMHDIGKFIDADTLGVSDGFKRTHSELYQPTNKDKIPTHRHVVNTAAFIEHCKDIAPPQLHQKEWGEGDIFMNLACFHHKPETPMQAIITEADALSSGWDRRDRDDSDAQSFREYKKQRLDPLFEELSILEDHAGEEKNHKHCYPLEKLSATSIFPKPKKDLVPTSDSVASAQYKKLTDGFLAALPQLFHRDRIDLWFEHFDSLVMTYASCIPADRSGKRMNDVSLYDHLRTTSALAAALYLYHSHEDSLTEEAIRKRDDPKFLFITSDFYGIQDFIFSTHGDTRKNRSKILRGRSFAVSLFSELAADMLCRAIGLPFTSVLLNGAGKFTIVAPNYPKVVDKLHEVEIRINESLIGISYGESCLGLSHLELSSADLTEGRFADAYEKIFQKIERRKSNRFNLSKYAGPITGYLDSFTNTLKHDLCPFCGKRPSDPKVENSSIIGGEGSSCAVCCDHIHLGTQLVKNDYMGVFLDDPDVKNLRSPILGRYSVAFAGAPSAQIFQKPSCVKVWNLSIDEAGNAPTRTASKFINGYVPTFQEGDEHDSRLHRAVKSPARLKELKEQAAAVGDPKTFGHLSLMALNFTSTDKVLGTEALAVLKMDIDNLGSLMGAGLDRSKFSLSRLATLSRQFDYFFSIHLRHKLETTPEFQNIYTVFAGGDDLFVIGPWNSVLQLAGELSKEFADYVCRNPAITFSAGITLHKAHSPVDRLAEEAEEALKRSKDSGRDRLTVFDETVTWDELQRLQSVKEDLKRWIESKSINNAMLYRLNEFLEMAGQEKKLKPKKEIHISEMACTKWRFLLAYAVQRNVGATLKDDARKKVVQEAHTKMTKWLMDFGSALRIPLWDILYNNR